MVPAQLPQIFIFFPHPLFFHRLVSVVLIDLMFKAPFLPVPGLELQWSLTKQTEETQECEAWRRIPMQIHIPYSRVASRRAA